MMSALESVLPFLLTCLSLASYFIGMRMREASHAVIPLYDPACLTTLTASGPAPS